MIQEEKMKAKWAIGLSILIAALLSGIVVGCQQEAGPQSVSGYGPANLYVDGASRLRTYVQGMEDGGNLISVDDGGGSITVDGVVGTELPAAAELEDATTNPTVPIVGGANLLYSGYVWDRERNNIEEELLSSASRITTVTTIDHTNYNGSRLLMIVDVTAINATPIITPTLQVHDPTADLYFTVWSASTALTAVGTAAYYFADGASGGSFTEIEAFGLPARTWRVRVLHHDTDAITYSIGSVISIY